MKVPLRLFITVEVLILNKIFLKAMVVDFERDIQYLADQLYGDLEASVHFEDPEASIRVAKKQITAFENVMSKQLASFKHSISKRSLDFTNEITTFSDYLQILNGFEEFNISLSMRPIDVGFYHNVKLNKSGIVYIDSMGLHICLMKEDHDLIEISLIPTANLKKISVIQQYNLVSVVALKSVNIQHFASVYVFNSDNAENIKLVQEIESGNTNVLLWLFQNRTHMLLTDKSGNEINIYIWKETYFDLQETIKPEECSNSNFDVYVEEDSFYIAVSCKRSKPGKLSTFSYLYNCPNSNQCIYSQGFRTHNVEDVKFFNIIVNKQVQHFLVFANFFIEEGNERTYDVYSVVYIYDKMTNVFVPFQGLKLNGAYNFLPIQDMSGGFLLLAATKFEGIKAFQFDGLKLIEVQTQYNGEVFSRSTLNMRFGRMNEIPIIAILNENTYSEMMTWFVIKFRKESPVSKYRDHLIIWCKENIRYLQSIDLKNYVKTIEKAPEEHKDPILMFQSSIDTPSLVIENSHIGADKINETEKQQLDKLRENLEEHAMNLNKIEENIQSLLRKSGTNEFEGDLYIDELILNENLISFDSIKTETINDLHIDPIINNIININEGFTSDYSLIFDEITISNQFQPKFINNAFDDNDTLYNVEIIGDAIFDKLYLKGELNKIKFQKENILLNKDQILDNLLTNNLVNAKKLEIQIEENPSLIETATTENSVLEYVSSLKVKKLFVRDFINDVNISTLNKFALKKSGNQIISANYTFESFNVTNVNTKNISGRNMKENIISTRNGSYRLDQDVIFLNDVYADSVYVSNNLNNIEVLPNNKLDILLTDAEDLQHINGYKEFEFIEVLNPIELYGRSSKLEKLNPISTINKEVVITGNYTINGNVKVINSLQADNLSSLKSYSIKQLQDYGLHTNDSEIPVHFIFKNKLNVNAVWIDAINTIKMNSLIKMGNESEKHIISAKKWFPGDVSIVGSSVVENVNSLDTGKLQAEIVQLDEDLKLSQPLYGNYYFDNIVAYRVGSLKTKLYNNFWNDVVSVSDDQVLEGTTIINNAVEANNIYAKMINSHTINGYNFNEIINDTVLDTPNRPIIGNTKFHSLITKNLDVLQTIQPKNINNKFLKCEFPYDLVLSNELVLEHIIFNKTFNKLSNNELSWLFGIKNETRIINNYVNFKEVNIESNLMVNTINKVNVSDIVNNSIKIDEDFHFNKMTINHPDGISANYTIILNGQFDSLNIYNILQSHTSEPQSITDEIIFHSNVTINGKTVFNKLISGLNLTKFCNLPTSNQRKNLHVEGNLIFEKPPIIEKLNNFSINELLGNIWFKDETTQISGAMEFNHIHFKEDINLSGLLNGKKVELLAKTYFSITRNQHVSATLEFLDKAVFKSGLFAKQVQVEGLLGKINFNEFMSTALLQNITQVFTNTPYFDKCKILELSGDYKVNDLELANDILLFDKENFITGKKVISDVHTKSLSLPEEYDRHIYVQNTNLLHLLKAAVLNYGEHRLTGKINFKGETFFIEGISSNDPVINGIHFGPESILLKSVPQNITSQKDFHPLFGQGIQSDSENIQPSITFKALNIQDRLNGINITNLLERQAYNNKDTVFKNKMNFNGSLSMENVNINKLYNNINVSQLIKDIIKTSREDNYLENYQKLYEVTRNINTSLSRQAFYLDYFEVRQIYSNVDIIVPVQLEGSNKQYLACVRILPMNYTISFNVWDKEAEIFRVDDGMKEIIMEGHLHYLTLITFKEKDYWYIETLSGKDKHYKGRIYELTSTANFKQVAHTLIHNGTKEVMSVMLPDENKNCFFFLHSVQGELFCNEEKPVIRNFLIKFQPYQKFNFTGNSFKAISGLAENYPYIFIINNQPSSIDIWRKESNKKFEIEQVIYISNPKSIAFTFNQGNSYLAIASGHVQKSKYPGFLDIRKLDTISRQFKTIQKIDINVPVTVEFAVLPSKELILYVLTDDPVKPLVVYEYQGISGFKEKVIGSTLPKVTRMRSFNTKSQHFILAKTINNTKIIQAVFQGRNLV